MTTTKMTKNEAESFLTMEMRLLDEWRLNEWLRLFTPEGVYWLPRETDSERRRQNAILFDGPAEREIRVQQLLLEHLAQSPPSQTVHLWSNVATQDSEKEDEALIRCNAVVYDIRPGGFQGLEVGRGVVRSLPGHFVYRMQRSNGGWAIAEKKVVLLARYEPLYNLTFIL